MFLTVESLWVLVVSLTMLAITASIHAVTSLHKAKMMENEVSTLIAKIAGLNESYNNKISSISNLHKTEVEKISISHKKEVHDAFNEFHNLKSPISNILAGMGYYNKK